MLQGEEGRLAFAASDIDVKMPFGILVSIASLSVEERMQP